MSVETGKPNILGRIHELIDHEAILTIKERLATNEKGSIRGVMNNYVMILRDDLILKDTLKLNLLRDKIDVVNAKWLPEEICTLTDDIRTYYYYVFETFYGLSNEKNMDKALRAVAMDHAYHPIIDYLEGLQWDGKERIRHVLRIYMGAEDSDLVYESLKHFMMEALQRIFKPGCKADEMLCLVGQQGAGKSTFFRFLAIKDEWFSDDLRNLGDSRVYEYIRGHWILEMSEMIATISARSNEEIKSFLTRQKETYRDPYAHCEKDRPRQCVFAGTTNTREFIPFDRSGSRRYLPIEVDTTKAEKHLLDDEAEARAYFDQLWAEAFEIYKKAEKKSDLMKFSEEISKQIIQNRRQFTQEDTMSGTIQDWLDGYGGDYVCSIQIWKEAFDRPDYEPKKYETNEICNIMNTQIIGWKPGGIHRFTKEGYGRQRCWERVNKQKPEDGNNTDRDGFQSFSKTEQMELPFH